MTTTEPILTKPWHAQNAEPVCAYLETDPAREFDPPTTCNRHPGFRIGAVLLATGLGQVILTTVGYFIAIALAMTPWQEPYA